MPDMRAIDCWVNVSVGSSRERAPDYALRTAEGYFKRSKDFFKTFSADELVAIMQEIAEEFAVRCGRRYGLVEAFQHAKIAKYHL